MGKKRLNVGLLISEYCDIFAREVCIGAMNAAEEMDINLFILAGGYFDAPYMERNKTKYEYQNNYLFQFATKENIDVLVVLLGTIASNVDQKVQKKFLDGFKDIPVITIANKVDGYPNVSFANKEGFAKAVEYLVNTLGKKNVGIVCGPATNEDSIERLEAYKEVLQKHNLPVEDKKIVYGNFTEYSDEAVEKLLDDNADLDAIVFSNDYMALSGYRVMEARGIKPGKDIAVVGFDDWPFAALMDPGLTTTRADSSELGYRAIKEACALEDGIDEDVRVKTTFIVRDSCGDRNKDALARMEEMFSFDLEKKDVAALVKQIREGVFDADTPEDIAADIEKALASLIDWMLQNVYKNPITDTLYNEITEQFTKFNDDVMKRIDNLNLMYEVNECLALLFSETVDSDRERIKIYSALAECYKNILLLRERERNELGREMDNLTRVTMTIMRDLVNDDDQTGNYDVLLSRMEQLDYKKSYLMLFPDVIRCRKNGRWRLPKNLLVKAYQKGKTSVSPGEDNQMIDVKDIFRIPFLEDGKRKTYAFSFLFSKAEQYGMLAVEPNIHNMNTIEAVAFQASSAIQTMRLLQAKEEVSAKLAESLEQLKETNAFLDEVSKSDELTQIYNRRGFLVTSRRVMNEATNMGKNAVVLYADMNNLKLINDKFGHEEGDYSLKSIAQILRDAMGEEAIIGRLGGDEFAVFLFMDDKKYEAVIRKRITQATEALNANNDKPYYISMSVGVSAFVNDGEKRMNDAMVRADVDLYLQKKHKRNKILK